MTTYRNLIAEYAESSQVQSDWAEEDNSSAAYIKNKQLVSEEIVQTIGTEIVPITDEEIDALFAD